MNRVTLFFLLLFSTQFSNAEIYRNIQPFTTLAELKEKFPGATFKPIKTAWTKEEESLYEVVGVGLPGKMIIKMSDSSVQFKNHISNNPDHEFDESFRSLAVSDETTVSVGWSDWVRYIPFSALPVERLVAKYGAPEASGYSDDDFSPYKSWPSKGVYASLTEDAKLVAFIEYSFTLSERCDAYRAIAKEDSPLCKTSKGHAAEKESKKAPLRK